MDTIKKAVEKYALYEPDLRVVAAYEDGLHKATEIILNGLNEKYVEVTDTQFVESSINIGVNRAKSVIKNFIGEE
jgi:hypothetical protein